MNLLAENIVNLPLADTQRLSLAVLNNLDITLEVLRLDKIDPIISGNKWFKLQLQLQDAIKKKHTSITTFGGAYSNHIIATAFACQKMGLNCIGIIRGEEPKALNHTLLAATQLGMQLQFVTRELYAIKQQLFTNSTMYYINEGGYAVLGANGIAEIYQWIDESLYRKTV